MAMRNYRGFGLTQDRGLIEDFFNTYQGINNIFSGNNAYQQARHQYDMMQAQLPLQMMQLEQGVRTQQAQDAIQKELLSGRMTPGDAANAYNIFGTSPQALGGNFWQNKQFEEKQRLDLMKLADDRKYQMMMAKAAMAGAGGGKGGGKDSLLKATSLDDFEKFVQKMVDNGMSRADAISYGYALLGGMNPEIPYQANKERTKKMDEVNKLRLQYEESKKADESAHAARQRALQNRGMPSGPVVDPSWGAKTAPTSPVFPRTKPNPFQY